ncbi:MAG: DEAD/DEAH box helicase family protein [Chloroflexi bacterium]|nr:DEAD/DEAH box helicase family protein [Chloroflexota bacterium]
MAGFQFEVDLTAFREHQRLAYDTVVENVRRGKKTTGIVLPPRYGKSDVIRMSAARLIADGVVSRAFFVTPNSILTAQLIDDRKVSDMAHRYKLGPAAPITTAAIENRPRLPFPNVAFAAMNIQLANNNMPFFTELVKSTIRKTGLAPVVYFDEIHTASLSNSWGRCIKEWQDAGAFIVGLTATPYRTDKHRLPGFTYRSVSNEPITIRRPEGEDKVIISEGEALLYQLEADYAIGFREVWDEADPPVLCKVTHQPFEVNLQQIDGLMGTPIGARRLSELSQDVTRAALTASVKDVGVVRDSCQKLVTELTNRQKDDTRTAAVVFVGNDTAEDEQANQHAKKVEAALRDLADFRVVRATSADAKADETIKRFMEGEGDVLVVKQMGGVGLDIDRLKVCLDLSSIRTRNNFIQRLTRICTVWNRTEDPRDRVAAAVYISPADCFAEALFQSLIRDQGGEAREYDFQEVREEKAGFREPAPPPDTYEVTGTDDAAFRDSDDVVAPGSQLSEVDQIVGIYPSLGRLLTKPIIAKGIPRLKEVLGVAHVPKEESHTNGKQSSVASSAFRNVGEELKQKRAEANSLAKQVATQRQNGTYKPKDPAWQKEIAQTWHRHKRRVFGRQIDLDRIVDPSEFDRLIESLKGDLKSGVSG